MISPDRIRSFILWGAVCGAFVVWPMFFGAWAAHFWTALAITVGALTAVALVVRRPPLDPFRVSHLAIGVVAALVLYGIFFVADLAARWMMPDLSAGVGAVYDLRATHDPRLVAALLVFPIGFGEEFFWRGTLQRSLVGRLGARGAWLATAAIYTALHLCTGNPMLVAAAALCGLFWGALYWRTGSIWPAAISHMIWDPLILIIAPLR